MRFSTLRKWLYLIATGTYLLQATVGCPNGNMIRGVASTSTQSLINGVIGLYVKAAVNQFFHV
ncbi:MAG: hypothetical protein HY718_16650 [Planctomycetes bacterium]|nr:hypothetical protein [Planctomycetota bacterium]